MTPRQRRNRRVLSIPVWWFCNETSVTPSQRGRDRGEGGEGPHEWQILHLTQDGFSLHDSSRMRWKCLLISCLLQPHISWGSTMDSSIMEIIEEFMESALAQWVCHLSSILWAREKVISSRGREKRIRTSELLCRNNVWIWLQRLYFHSSVLDRVVILCHWPIYLKKTSLLFNYYYYLLLFIELE